MGEEKGEEIEGGNGVRNWLDILAEIVKCGDDQCPLFCRTDPIRPLARDSATGPFKIKATGE